MTDNLEFYINLKYHLKIKIHKDIFLDYQKWICRLILKEILKIKWSHLEVVWHKIEWRALVRAKTFIKLSEKETVQAWNVVNGVKVF